MSSHEPDKQSLGEPPAREWLEESHAEPQRLASLFQAERELFSEAELGALLAHQLASPLSFHWPKLNERLAQETAGLTAEERAAWRTFGDLLGHPRPPAALLMLVKDFAKRLLKRREMLLPRPLGSVRLFTAIAAARAQGLEKVTDLDEEGVRQGMSWALNQAWVGEPCRGILEKGWRAMDDSAIRE